MKRHAIILLGVMAFSPAFAQPCSDATCTKNTGQSIIQHVSNAQLDMLHSGPVIRTNKVINTEEAEKDINLYPTDFSRYPKIDVYEKFWEKERTQVKKTAFQSLKSIIQTFLHGPKTSEGNLMGLSADVYQKALNARSCAIKQGYPAYDKIAIIDYDLPSTRKRLWVVDVEQRKALMNEWVAHGHGSGDKWATSFSNTVNSYKTSLGLYRVSESYYGKGGLSMRLDGIEPGLNDKARERAIVMHGAWYANPEHIAKAGRLGRSEGCPAVRQAVIRTMVNELNQQAFLFAYHKNDWERGSRLLHCDS